MHDIPLLPHTSSWHGAHLSTGCLQGVIVKHMDSFTLHLPHSYQNLSLLMFYAYLLMCAIITCLFLSHYLSPQHVLSPISLLVSHCESLSAFLVGQSHSS